MTRMILSGANGHMGRVVARCAAAREDCSVVAGIDPNTASSDSFPVFDCAEDCNIEADVIIDFSHPSALQPLLKMASARHLPVVVCTTGLAEEQIALIRKASRQIPVFFSANMSLGINLMVELCKTAARILGPGFDVEIIEKHHNQKIDAPSGTALMLANGISSVLAQKPEYVYDRHSVRQKRSSGEVGLHAVRGGTIVGEHDVLFAGLDEVLTIHHSATSKEVFATGSLSAALFLAGKDAGMYDMSDLIQEG